MKYTDIQWRVENNHQKLSKLVSWKVYDMRELAARSIEINYRFTRQPTLRTVRSLSNRLQNV